MDYLDEFIRDKVNPYRRIVEQLPLKIKISIRDDIEALLDYGGSFDFGPVAEEVRETYQLTAELGKEFRDLLTEQSGIHMRLGDDYAIVFSKIMASFDLNEETVLERRIKIYGKDRIEKERMLRTAKASPGLAQAFRRKSTAHLN